LGSRIKAGFVPASPVRGNGLLVRPSGDPHRSTLNRLERGAVALEPVRLCGLQGPPGRWSNDVRLHPSPCHHTLVLLDLVGLRPGEWPNGAYSQSRSPSVTRGARYANIGARTKASWQYA